MRMPRFGAPVSGTVNEAAAAFSLGAAHDVEHGVDALVLRDGSISPVSPTTAGSQAQVELGEHAV